MATDGPPRLLGILHVALTVTDGEATAAWHERVLHCRRVTTVHHEGGYGIVVATADERVWLVLHEQRRTTDETRTGLDHVCFQVEGRGALEDWSDWLDSQGVTHDPIRHLRPVRDVGLVMRDLDHIPLELISC